MSQCQILGQDFSKALALGIIQPCSPRPEHAMNTDPQKNELGKTMNLLVGKGPDAMKIAKALGLPKFTRRFTLDMPVDDAAVVTVESRRRTRR